MMGCHLSVIPGRIAVTHRVLRIRSWRVGIQRAWMNPKVLLLMPSTWCMFALDLRGRFRLASIRSFSLTIRCIRVSRRVPNIHRILIMLEYFIDCHLIHKMIQVSKLIHRIHLHFYKRYSESHLPSSLLSGLTKIPSCSIVFC